MIQVKLYKTKSILCSAIILSLSACTTIPQESVDLSIELGKQMTVIESSHMVLVEKYFAEKRDRVDEYFAREWVPELATQFYENDQVKNLWDQVVRSDEPVDRLQFIITFGPQLQARINKERLAMIKPLDNAEREIKQHLSISYNQARSINNSVTSFLVSASKVAENRNRYLDMIGVKEETLSSVIDQVDSAVGGLTEKAEKVASKEDKAKEYHQKLTEVLHKLNKDGGK